MTPFGAPTGRLAIFPGSFDPLTNGHVDIILRSAHLFERIIVSVLLNAEKEPLFTADERVTIIREVFREYPNVEVDTFDGLLVEYARNHRASAIVRGLRAVSDFEYEFQMALIEPSPRAHARDGVHDASRAVHVPQFAADQGSVHARRRRPRPRAGRGGAVAAAETGVRGHELGMRSQENGCLHNGLRRYRHPPR